MDWKAKNVLITGATGLLGGWLTKRLASKGANVVTITRDDVPGSFFYMEGLEKKAARVFGCLEDYAIVERTLNEYEIEACFHFGAQTIVGTANRSPLSTFESNIKGTWNMLEAARNSRLLKCLVVASTDKAYGRGEAPYTENTQLAAAHPYDVSKVCADMLASSYFETYGLPVGITRCGNIFGGGDLNYNRIIPGTIRSILMNKPPLVRSDGKMVRDYVYVEDIVDANLLLAENLLSGKERGEAFNFSWEQPQTVLEVIGKIKKAMGSDIEPEILSQATNEIPVQYLSAEKARTRLGWKPGWNFETGLSKTVEWYRKYAH